MKKLLSILTFVCLLVANSFGYAYSYPTPPAFDTPFQVVDPTYNVTMVAYTIQIDCALSVTGSVSGTAILEVSASGIGGWQKVAEVSNGFGGTLVLGLGLTNPKTFELSGGIPQNYYIRIRKVTSMTGIGNSAPTMSITNAQETSV